MPEYLDRHRIQAAIALIASRQHGVITQAQLVECGLATSVITDWVKAGRLHRIHRGVYAVGHPGLSIEGEWMAAVLACGEGAVLSHRSAAMLWGMLEPKRGTVHVTVPTYAGRRKRTGVTLHRSESLPHSQTTLRDAIPVTKPSRTLTDLHRLGNEGEYRRALRQAEYLRLPIGEKPAADGTRSGLERRFLRFCSHHHLPRPEVNARVGPFTVDFLWRAEGVIVETDSYWTHGGAIAFAEDRERDLWMKGRGLEVVRVTDERLGGEQASLAATLRGILERRRLFPS